jgi:DNA/RNA endonuclease G (NUC1)
MFKILIIFISFFPASKDTIRIENNIFKVIYSQELEQPLELTYKSINRVKNVDRRGLNFYLESNIITSNNGDYYNNVYDKGHLAPAATFSDNMENLKQTFSYLNCVLQHEKLNRGAWAKLERKERKWDDEESLLVIVNVIFNEVPKRLPSNAAIPLYFKKHIFFEEKKVWRCFIFPNVKPKFSWEKYEVECLHK